MLATGNALVRVILTATGIQVQRQESQLRGGRVIGPMERLLIFGFVLVGQPTGAALIVAAKSLLRFPEVNRAGPATGDATQGGSEPRIPPGDADARLSIAALSEYFLVGSLASWLIALAPALLLGSAG